MSDWLFDLGNTRLKCAPLVDGRCGEVVALAHGEAGFAEKLDALLPQRGGVAHLASVVPQALAVDVIERLAARAEEIGVQAKEVTDFMAKPGNGLTAALNGEDIDAVEALVA